MLAQEAYRLQLRCFQSMVQEQQHLPSLKQLLKLYTAISLPKLASLMDMNETTLRSQLMLLKVALSSCNNAFLSHRLQNLERCRKCHPADEHLHHLQPAHAQQAGCRGREIPGRLWSTRYFPRQQLLAECAGH